MNPAIDIQNITISYREGPALNSISLKIAPGEFVGIAGPNGAGKTTLLRVINGLARSSQGQVSIFGRRMSPRSQSALRRDIGYAPQIFNIDVRMPIKVREAVMLGRYGRLGLFKQPASEDNSIVEQVLELTGISKLAHKPIGQLSGGEQRKVAIARALAQSPRILLLDEPLSNLDINAQTAILKLIDRIYQQQKLTTVIVMHQLNLLAKNCSRMILLTNAKIIFDGSTEAALQEDILSKLYECRVEIIKDNRGVVMRARESEDY